jgi:hypothetical protein
MTDSSSAGNPDGAALPADHPLGPASPVPPLEKESDVAEQATDGSAATPSEVGAPAGHDAGGSTSGSTDDGSPAPDRREDILDPSAGSAGQPAATIRDEQHTSAAGTVPAAFNGTGTPEDPEENRRPEDAATEPDTWDSGGAKG